MLRKFKSTLGNFVRAAQGIYQDKVEKYAAIPDGVESFEVGKSTEGRTVKAYRIGNGERPVLLMGGIHGNEVGTIKLMYKLLDFLASHDWKLEIYVIPCLNPDGHEMAKKRRDYYGGGRFGRFNANDVDLNRNFDTKSFTKNNRWFFGSDYVDVFCGEKGLSEVETAHLASFVKERGIEVLYSFHSRGKEVMGNNNDLSENLARNFALKTGYRYVSFDEWKEMNQTGTLREWCDENDVAYVEVESATRWGSDWKNQKEAIIESLKYLNG